MGKCYQQPGTTGSQAILGPDQFFFSTDGKRFVDLIFVRTKGVVQVFRRCPRQAAATTNCHEPSILVAFITTCFQKGKKPPLVGGGDQGVEIDAEHSTAGNVCCNATSQLCK
jgi:hypothetical protein